MSRERRRYCVFGFASTHDALDAEKVLESGGFDVVPIPAPPSISATCGIALRVPGTVSEEASASLLRCGLAPESQVTIEDY